MCMCTCTCTCTCVCTCRCVYMGPVCVCRCVLCVHIHVYKYGVGRSCKAPPGHFRGGVILTVSAKFIILTKCTGLTRSLRMLSNGNSKFSGEHMPSHFFLSLPQVAVAAKNDVGQFDPQLPRPAVFEKVCVLSRLYCSPVVILPLPLVIPL